MDYCPTCRRHLNGALACPGCGAYSDDRRKAEFQERYQSPYGRVPPQRPAPAAFSPAYGGYASAPQVLAQPPQPRAATPPPVEYPPVDYAAADYVAVDYPAVDYPAVDYAAAGYAGPEFAGEAEPVAPEGAYAPTVLLPAEQELERPDPEPLPADEGPEGTPDAEDGEYGEDTGEQALVPAGVGRAERRQAAGGRGRGQNHRQSRRRRRSVAFTAVGLVVGGLVAWEGGVSALSLGEFGQAPVASPDTGPSASPSAGAGGDGASASASAQPIAGNGVPTGRAASPSAKPSAKASASATHAASASPTAERTVVAAGGASTTAPATTHPTPSPTTAAPSPSPTCSAHFLWWCTG